MLTRRINEIKTNLADEGIYFETKREALDGKESRFVGAGLGSIHIECEYLPIHLRAEASFRFVSLNTHAPITVTVGDVFDVPGLQALGLIRKHAAVRVEVEK